MAPVLLCPIPCLAGHRVKQRTFERGGNQENADMFGTGELLMVTVLNEETAWAMFTSYVVYSRRNE